MKMVRALRKSNPSGMKSALARQPKAPVPAAPKTVGERVSSALIGVKGASLHPSQELEENPMTRLKLLIVSIFVLLPTSSSNSSFSSPRF